MRRRAHKRATVAGGEQDIADLGQGLKRLAGDDGALLRVFAHGADAERPVGALDLGGKLLQGDAIKRELFGIGFDAELLRLFADDIGEADVGQFGDFDLKFARQPR